MVIYELLTGGVNPFKLLAREKQKHVNECTTEEEVDLSQFSATQRGLLEGLLQKKPAKRFDSPDIFSHPFFADIDWTALDAGVLTAPFVPSDEGMHTIAAYAVGDIDTAEGDRFGWDEKKEFTEKEKAQLAKFHYVGALSFQDEIVDALHRGGVIDCVQGSDGGDESKSDSKYGRRGSRRGSRRTSKKPGYVEGEANVDRAKIGTSHSKRVACIDPLHARCARMLTLGNP